MQIDGAPSVELTAVPFFPQTAYQCGPAALSTMLAAAGEDVAPDDLVSQVYLPGREGSLQFELMAAARLRGFVPYVLAPQLDSVLHEVRAGNPVLVLQNLSMALCRGGRIRPVGRGDDSSIWRGGAPRDSATALRAHLGTWRVLDDGGHAS
jgi:hypothetical protein